MKTLFVSLLTLVTLFATAQQEAKDNVAVLYVGDAAQKQADARINITYTGKVERLLEVLAEAHGRKFELLKEGADSRTYRAVQVPKPAWVYGNLNVYVEVAEVEKGKTKIAIYHTYYEKTQNVTGSTLGQLQADVLEFYQEAVNTSLKK